LTFKGLHGVISKRTELFITMAVRTSDVTILKWILKDLGARVWNAFTWFGVESKVLENPRMNLRFP
jgi:hypothetical protein